MLWNESSLKRVRKCKRVPVGEVGDALLRMKDGVAHYANLATCGSIWACPVCAAKIRDQRAQEISEATAKWINAGNEVYMVTFTMPHDFGMKLKPMVSVVADGFRSVISGRAWAGESRSAYAKRVETWEVNGLPKGKPKPERRLGAKERLGIVGQIRAFESTHGDNGWHPHLHVLVYVKGQLDAAGLVDLHQHMKTQWQKFVTKAGYRTPSDEHGVVIDKCESGEDAGRYIAKTQDGKKSVGNEMARFDMKSGSNGGRTPFEILDDFRWTGDAADLRLIREHEQATKGRQCITWSAGLRKLLIGDEEEISDEELAQAEVGGDDLASIPGETYKVMTRTPGLPSAVLDAVEQGGLEKVNELLARHGLPGLHPLRTPGDG